MYIYIFTWRCICIKYSCYSFHSFSHSSSTLSLSLKSFFLFFRHCWKNSVFSSKLSWYQSQIPWLPQLPLQLFLLRLATPSLPLNRHYFFCLTCSTWCPLNLTTTTIFHGGTNWWLSWKPTLWLITLMAQFHHHVLFCVMHRAIQQLQWIQTIKHGG